MIFKSIQHLLPNALAWTTTATKNLRGFFQAMGDLGDDVRDHIDGAFENIDPQKTQQLDAYERQFNLKSVVLSEQERRDRLDAAWKATGGQSPKYIQDRLQEAGFDVYVHDWFDPASRPPVNTQVCVVPRSPIAVLRPEYTQTVSQVDCGEALAECGEAFAECGNGTAPLGYPLVNKISITEIDIIPECGEPGMECGEAFVTCGNFTDLIQTEQNYVVPSDVSKWPYFMYVGGETYPDVATVPELCRYRI